MKKYAKWLAFLGSLALTIPLIWLLSLVLPWRPPQGQMTSGIRVVPYLSNQERFLLKSYSRPCENDNDCEPPLTCFAGLGNGESWCTDTHCATDTDCEEGFSCQPRVSIDETALLYICAPLGIRKEGERCTLWPRSQEEACERGLRCRQGWCGRSCRPGEQQSCPEGFSCNEGLDGASCLPDCKRYSCPEGQYCVRYSRLVSACARVESRNCQQTPCPEGQKCLVNMEMNTPGVVTMRCASFCTPGGSDCPQGSICFMRMCLQPCDPYVPESCGPGSQCKPLFRGSPLFCRAND